VAFRLAKKTRQANIVYSISRLNVLDIMGVGRVCGTESFSGRNHDLDGLFHSMARSRQRFGGLFYPDEL
jgi:hypothetical protein